MTKVLLCYIILYNVMFSLQLEMLKFFHNHIITVVYRIIENTRCYYRTGRGIVLKPTVLYYIITGLVQGVLVPSLSVLGRAARDSHFFARRYQFQFRFQSSEYIIQDNTVDSRRRNRGWDYCLFDLNFTTLLKNINVVAFYVSRRKFS